MDFDALAFRNFFLNAEHAFRILLSLYGVVLAGAMGLSLVSTARGLLTPGQTGLLPRLAKWRASRRFRALPVLSGAPASLESGSVRLRGLVEGGDHLRAAELSGLRSVAYRVAYGERGGGSVHDDTWASDFDLRLCDGTSVRVLAREASAQGLLKLIDGKAERWNSPTSREGWFCESRLVPGDEIEIVGTLLRQIDLSAERSSDRQAPLRWKLLPVRSGLFVYFDTRPAPPRPAISSPALASFGSSLILGPGSPWTKSPVAKTGGAGPSASLLLP
jgi:hypothetical protein